MRLELDRSLALAAAIVAAHLAAAACAYAVVPGFAGLALAAALVSLGFVAAWSRALLASAGSVRALEIADSALTLELASGDRFEAEVPARRYVSRWLVILPIRRPQHRTVLVTADMLGGDSFRRLRLWALWGRVSGVPAPPPAGGTALH